LHRQPLRCRQDNREWPGDCGRLADRQCQSPAVRRPDINDVSVNNGALVLPGVTRGAQRLAPIPPDTSWRDERAMQAADKSPTGDAIRGAAKLVEHEDVQQLVSVKCSPGVEMPSGRFSPQHSCRCWQPSLGGL